MCHIRRIDCLFDGGACSSTLLSLGERKAHDMSVNYPDLRLLVGGEWRDAENRPHEDVLNPANENVLARLPHATARDLENALDAAAKGFALWRAVPAQDRSRILKRAADLIRERAEELARIATL